MSDRLTGIEVFVRAVRLGSLSAAAREMRMSPAMAAKHLTALETRLGATLANRTTRRFSLTEAGEVFLDKAERILAELGEAEAEASARTVAIEGLLRVSAPAAFGVLHLAPLVAEFYRLNPAVVVEMGLNDRYVDLLEERWDMAIRIGQLADSSLIARKLADVRLNICASPAYLCAKGTPRSVSDLKDHECLGYTLSARSGHAQWGFGGDGSIKVAVNGVFRANNGSVLVQAASDGLGLVYGPRFLAADAVAKGQLVEIKLDKPLMKLGAIFAVSHPARRPAAKTRAWIDFLADRVRRMSADW
jgi:DNA-binding transcriptional LysR family regulator